MLAKTSIGIFVFINKKELIKATLQTPPTNNSEISIHTLAILYVPTFATIPSSIFRNSLVRYFEKNFQRIFKIILEAKTSPLTPQPIFFFNKLCKRLLKASFNNFYYDKTYIECYNFCQ